MKPALENTIFDTLKTWRLLSRRSSGGGSALSGVEAFVLGLLARAVCTVCTFPATRGLRIQQGRRKKKMEKKKVKVKMSGQEEKEEKEEKGEKGEKGEEKEEELEKEEKEEEESLVGVLLNLIRSNGMSELYVGIGPDLGRGVLSSAIRYSIKERIQEWMKF